MERTRLKGQQLLWKYIRSYLTVYLPRIRALSPNTVDSYRESISLYCSFLKEQEGIGLAKVSFDDVSRASVSGFIQSLRDRGCKASTCNLRLSSLKSFLKYCAEEDIGLYSIYQEAKKVPLARAARIPVRTMSQTALRALLAEPDARTTKGMRNRMVMVLLYDAALRVQELVDLKTSDLQLQAENPFILVTGKGGKTRSVPVMEKTVAHLKEYLKRFHSSRDGPTRDPLFYSIRSDGPHGLSTDAVAVMLKNYGESARKSCPELPVRVHPHLLRHTRATDLYRAGMPLSYIAEFLGHASVNTTDIYASADTGMLRDALQKADPGVTDEVPLWKEEESLRRLCGL
jgi:integrase/recombinase XerD